MALYTQTGNQFNAAQGIGRIVEAQSAALSSGRQMLQTLTGAAQTVQGIAEKQFEQEMKVQAEKATIQGVIDGEFNVKPDQLEADLRDDTTNFYNKAYNEAQRTRVAANIRRTVQEKSLVLAEQFKNDAEGYKNAMSGLSEELIKEYGIEGKESQSLFFKEIGSEASRYAPQIMRNQYVLARETELATKMESMQTDFNHVLSSLRVTGDENRFNEDMVQFRERIDAMVAAGDMSPTEGLKMKQGLVQEGQAQLGWSRVGPMVEAGNVSGAEAQAKAWRDEQFKRGVLSPDQIDSEYNRFMSDINSKKAELKAAAREAAKFDAAEFKVQNGLPLDYKDKSKGGDVAYVDSIYDNTFGALDLNDQNSYNNVAALAKQLGVVPTKVQSYVRASVYSKDPVIQANGAALLNTLIKANPFLEDQFSSEQIKFATNVKGGMETGHSLEESVQMANVAKSSDGKALYAVNDATFENAKDKKETIVKYATSLMEDARDRLFEFGETTDKNIEAVYFADYEKAFENGMSRATTVDGAKEYANQQMSKLYGITYVNGKREFTKYPMEQTILGLSADQVTKDNPVAKQVAEAKKEALKFYNEQNAPKKLELKETTPAPEDADKFKKQRASNIVDTVGEWFDRKSGEKRQEVAPAIEREKKEEGPEITMVPTNYISNGVPVYGIYATDPKTKIQSQIGKMENGRFIGMDFVFDKDKYISEETEKKSKEQKEVEELHQRRTGDFDRVLQQGFDSIK